MLELPHATVGLLIASKIPNPLISIPLSFASHFLIDLIPHWNPSLYTETKKNGKPSKLSNKIIVTDVALSLIIGFFLVFRSNGGLMYSINLLLSAFAAVLPDVIEGFYFYLGIKSKWLMKLIKFQHDHQARAKFIPGIITQAAITVACLIFLF